MGLSEGTWVVLAINLVFVIVQFAVLKNDTSWIKNRLCAGNERLNRHERRLNNHQASIASIVSGCQARHPGATFPPVGNHQGDDDA